MKSDVQILQDVLDQLAWEPDITATDITVTVKNGIVTLEGLVNTYSQKVTAEEAVKKIAGVRAVAEEIQVRISPAYKKTDAEIAEAVLFALKWNSHIPDGDIKVMVQEGVVTLEGEVEWDFQRIAARNAIKNLAGVRWINNNIMIRPLLEPNDIKQKITAAFMRSATIDAEKIAIETQGSTIILKGKVRSIAEREDAENAAWSAPGVTSVENELVVEEEAFAF